MPSERFYRLSDGKRQTIREAAVKELSRVPFEKASINQIIQCAEISRGSFYTYFEDKNDLLKWLFEDSCKQMTKVCEDTLRETKGDYFAMLDQLFCFFVRSSQETKEMMEVARNVFSSPESAKVLGISGFPSPTQPWAEDSPTRKVFKLIDKERMRVPDFESFSALTAMGGAVVMMSVRQYYEYPDQLEQIRKNFSKALELLQYGAYKAEVSK